MAVNLDVTAYHLAVELLECLCAQLELTVGGPVCRCCLAAGAGVPADFCCDCGGGHGQAWVRVARIYPTTARFPNAQVEPDKCALGMWAVELELGAYRCAATVDGRGNPPSCERVTRDAEVILDDAAAMRRAANCCFRAGEVGRQLMVGQWQPYGPDGGCIGGSMVVTVRSADCCPPRG